MPNFFDQFDAGTSAPPPAAALAAPQGGNFFDQFDGHQAVPDDKYRAAARDEYAANQAAGVPQDSPWKTRMLQGATFNTADEIAAAAMTPFEMIKRGTLDPAEAYRYTKAREDLNVEHARDQTGTLGTAAEIGGGVLSGSGLAHAGVGFLGRLAPQAGLGARTLASAGDAGLYGAVAGAGEGNSLPERAGNAAVGGTLGALLGGVAPGALKLAGAAAAPILSNVSARLNPARYAQNQVARAISESGQSPQDLSDAVTTAAQQGQPEFTLADAMGNAGQRQLSSVTRAPGVGRTEAVNFLDQRQAGQGRRVSNALAEGFDAPETAEQTQTRLTNARDTASDVNYDAARQGAGPVDVTRTVDRIDQTLRPGVNQFANPGTAIAPDSVEAALGNVRNRLTDGNSQLTDFESLQRVRGDLSDAISAAQRAGAGNKVRLLSQVRTEMDVAMERASPGFMAANRAHAAASQAIDAVDTGRQAAMRGRTENTVPAFRAMPANQQDAFRSGYVDPLIEQVQGGAVGVNKARPFTSDAFRTEAAAVAPMSTGNQMMQRIGRENTMFETRGHATGGSRTADNLADANAMGIDPSLIGDIVHGNWVGAARQLMSAGSNALTGNTAAVRQEVGRLLLMRGSNVAPGQLQQLLTQAVRLVQNRQLLANRLGSGVLAGGAVAPAATGQR